MPDDNRLITLAIHTFDKAVVVKSMLESEGVKATLQNVNLSEPVVSPGVRVRISESDLPKALRIIENDEIYTSHQGRGRKSAAPVLVPTDFSDCSTNAALVAFEIASLLKAPIQFLHAYLDPTDNPEIQLSAALNYDMASDAAERRAVEMAAKQAIEKFAAQFRTAVTEGIVPPVKFSTTTVEGLPEEVILEAAKQLPSPMIVMGTRGSDKKERELVGSVTAEVLDSCRVPVFTIPESVTHQAIKKISDIVMLSSLDQTDILVIDSLHRLFPSRKFNITIAHIPGRRQRRFSSSDKAAKAIIDYCSDHYKSYRFNYIRLNAESAVEDYKELESRQKVDLIVVPNKKQNILARLFNPGIAHRLLFHSDTPMMVVPV